MTETQSVLPMPEHLDAPNTARTLTLSVRHYLYPIYNDPDGRAKAHLASVDHQTSVTGNLYFDRKVVAEMVLVAAQKANDHCFDDVNLGKIFQCISRVLKKDHPEVALGRRRLTYRGFTQPQRAAA